MVRLSYTLSKYIFWRSVAGFGVLFLGLSALIFIVDFIELMRRADADNPVGFLHIVSMALLKLPHTGEMILPFTILFGSMYTFYRLTRSQELIVARSAGVSVWQFLLPGVVAAAIVALFILTTYNPVAASMLTRYETLENKYLRGQSSLMSLSSTGLWVRQHNADGGYSLLNGEQLIQENRELRQVMIFRFNKDDQFIERIDADRAVLKGNHWELSNIWLTERDDPPIREKTMQIPTDINFAKIQDSFAPPETLSFWALPGFINTLRKSGFNAIRHRLHWHRLLALPILFSAMMMTAAAFALRLPRRGQTGALLSAGLISGFLIYFLSDLIYAYGLSGQIPVVLAAWTPAIVILCAGTAILLHMEDG